MSSITTSDGGNRGQVQYHQFLHAKRHTNRFCMNLSDFEKHESAVEAHKHPAKCAVCSLPAYKKCSLCNVSLHHNDTRGAGKGKQCFLHYHNPHHFGLCFSDRALLDLTANDWTQHTRSKGVQNKRLIDSFVNRMN